MFKGKNMKEVFLKEPWNKSFKKDNIIFVNENDVLSEFKILELNSFFGEYIDRITLENVITKEILFFSINDNIQIFLEE